MPQSHYRSICLSAAEIARLDTLMIEIAEDARSSPAVESIDGFRLGTKGSLWIGRSAVFHDFEAGKGGRGAVSLIGHLFNCDGNAATDRAREWLDTHDGTGRLDASGVDDDGAGDRDNTTRQAFIDTLWAESKPGKDVEALRAYLARRELKIDEPDWCNLRWIEHSRGEEGALIASVTDNEGDFVALQETYITPDGQKSPHAPARRTLRGPHDWRQRGFVRFGNPDARNATICEGLEDGLSIRMAGADLVLVTLGVSSIGKGRLPAGVKEVTVVRDNDPQGSPAVSSLWRGVVRLAGQGVNVKVTPRPSKLFGREPALKDANDVLKARGIAGVTALLDAATDKLGDLNVDAIGDEVAQMSDDAYELARSQLAKKLGWRKPILDKARTARRAEWARNAGSKHHTANEDTPWPDPVADIGVVLDIAVAEVAKYIVAPSAAHDTIVLWSAAAHLLHRTDLRINVAPRLAVQSPTMRSGKSTTLEIVHNLTPRPVIAGSITTSSLFRIVDADRPTLLIDEADNVVRRDSSPDLLAVLNSGHRRSTAFVIRSERGPDDNFVPVKFSTFTAIAFAGIEELPAPLQDRSIILYLQRAKPGEIPEHLEDGTSSVLLECRRKFARWANDLDELPPVDLPAGLFNRLGDNWRTMFRIAALAGDSWPERVKNAACGAPDEDANDLVALLAAIWEIFKERGVVRIYSQDLVDALLDVDEGRWKQADRGRPITPYYLRGQLKGVIPHSKDADDARRWREGGANARWGFTEMHFEGAWSRYLLKGTPSGKSYSQDAPPEERHQDGSSSDTYGTAPENGVKTDGYDVSDNGSDGVACRTASDTLSGQGKTPDSDVSDGVRHGPASDTPEGTAESEQFHSVNREVSDVSDRVASESPSLRGARRRSRTELNSSSTQRGGEAK